MKNGLVKGILIVFIANIINLFFNVILNFALPKYLSIDSYAEIKTFTLYLSYSGLLHLGYEDGMYLKYGGIEKGRIKVNELDINASTLRVFQLWMAIIIVIIGIVLKEPAIYAFGLALLPYNLMIYFKQFYQAIGEFEEYSKILNITTMLLFISQIIWLILKIDCYGYYLASNVVVYFLIWIILEKRIRKKIGIRYYFNAFSLNELFINIKAGFLLMLGNFSYLLIMGIDRWFVKFTLPTLDFALYSFAVSMESFMNTAVSPIYITLYNYFCKTTDCVKIKKAERYIMLFAVTIVMCAFPAKLILDVWLQKYKAVTSVLFWLFAGRIFCILCQCIYMNLYKARKMQNKYFVKLLLVVLVGVLFNFSLFSIMHTKEAYAIGTFLTMLVWFLICQFDFKDVKFKMSEYIYICMEVILFLISGNLFDSLTGFLIYFVGTCILSSLFVRSTVQEIIIMSKNYISVNFQK